MKKIFQSFNASLQALRASSGLKGLMSRRLSANEAVGLDLLILGMFFFWGGGSK